METKACGRIDLCKEASVRDGVTLRDHLLDKHPHLFTKPGMEMLACSGRISIPGEDMCAACAELGEYCIENGCTCNCHA